MTATMARPWVMLATYTVPLKTPLTFDESCAALRWALAPNGVEISRESLALGLAKTALETGRWQEIWNYNFGNVKAGSTYVGMFTAYPCNEVLAGKVVWFRPEGELAGKNGVVTGQQWTVPPAHPQTRFRAFANEYDGALEYVGFLQGGRWKPAYEALIAGNARAYVVELKRAGYFTADLEPYYRGVASLRDEFLARLQGHAQKATPIDVSLVEEVARLQSLWWAAVLADDPGRLA